MKNTTDRVNKGLKETSLEIVKVLHKYHCYAVHSPYSV